VAFTKAIQLDQADPLPRLGLGLTQIRDGDLKEGGRDIEVAASLDPNNSLVRSYLGKTYFEEKRTGLDLREYEIAKELDPNDPTPWFYGAIAKQTTNRPVEALHDLQKSRELNDNRAVYRSKLALDSDLAARSSSIARIYNDLGFQARGLFEGWMSVNTDPTNYSAHRFLADTYAVLPRHKIARVSELLQSQLLQPTNITPIQPVLGESNLFLISAQGPADLSFREFNPLFNRDRVALQATGLYGENDNDLPDNDTWAGEGIVSGIYKNLSFSGGYTHFDTNGFRINNDQEDDIANVFAQLELTSKTSIQAEYRYRKTENGDIRRRFFADDFESDRREEDEADSIRFGFRHAFSPAHNFIGNFMYQDAEALTKREFEDAGIQVTREGKSDQEAFSGELQYLFRSEHIDIVTGGGYFDVDTSDVLTQVEVIPGFTVTFPNPFPPPPFITLTFPPDTTTETSTADRDVNHTNLYVYSYINPLENLTITLGASGDFFDSKTEDEVDTDQFNPKFGIMWNPLPNTTLRGAVFRVLKRTLITNQTLEPTQVAGFNQSFDDDTATESWRYGGAIDQKFSESIYGGAEFTYRDLTVPFLIETGAPGTFQLEEADWEEKVGRAYLYWTPHKWFALSGEYLYERFERSSFASGAREVKTQYVPLGINFFHPSGFSAFLKGTYVDQSGSFERLFQAGVFEPGEDDFWVVDVAINYRLPKRYGFITVGASNLFDEEFQYFDTDPTNPRLQPDRFIFAKVTLAIP
jgi:tetratricopeptide (TPR) repeat protein